MSELLMMWSNQKMQVCGPNGEKLVATVHDTWEEFNLKLAGQFQDDDFVYFPCRCPRDITLVWACRNIGPGVYRARCELCNTKMETTSGILIGMEALR